MYQPRIAVALLLLPESLEQPIGLQLRVRQHHVDEERPAHHEAGRGCAAAVVAVIAVADVVEDALEAVEVLGEEGAIGGEVVALQEQVQSQEDLVAEAGEGSEARRVAAGDDAEETEEVRCAVQLVKEASQANRIVHCLAK